jgi:hypothetical protein
LFYGGAQKIDLGPDVIKRGKHDMVTTYCDTEVADPKVLESKQKHEN